MLNDLLAVKVTSKLNPDTWDNVGDEFVVKEYPYKATYGCTINKCFCPECVSYRAGKELYPMYEVVYPASKRGNILFQQCCEIVDS